MLPACAVELLPNHTSLPYEAAMPFHTGFSGSRVRIPPSRSMWMKRSKHSALRRFGCSAFARAFAKLQPPLCWSVRPDTRCKGFRAWPARHVRRTRP